MPVTRDFSAQFFPPADGKVLSPEGTDQLTGAPLWLPAPPGARWARLGTSVQLADRLVDQGEQCEFVPPRHRGDPGIGPDALTLDTSWIAPCWMPRLAPITSNHQPLFDSRERRDLASYAAWARDVAGLPVREIARLLFLRPGGLHLVADDLDRAKYRLGIGRRFYAACGVLPWAVYEDGKVPSEWPSEQRFVEAVKRWISEAAARDAA